jgi:hypothetical protein
MFATALTTIAILSILKGINAEYQLILRHKNVLDGVFDKSFVSTGLENENDPDANTYSIIGSLVPANYLSADNKYQLKMVYYNIDAARASTHTLIWRQSSWITSSTKPAAGYEALSVAAQPHLASTQRFGGLHKSAYSSRVYLDGAVGGNNYRNSAGLVWQKGDPDNNYHWLTFGPNIPAFDDDEAYGQALYIYAPDTEPEPKECPPPECARDAALDIAFLLDESGSIDAVEWQTMIDFVAQLIRRDINDASYVSLMEYANQEDFDQFLAFTSTAGSNKEDIIINALQTNAYTSTGATYTGYAIQRAIEAFAAWDASDDPNNERPNLLLVVTDGIPSVPVCSDASNVFNVESVEVVIVGIGQQLTQIEQEFGCLYDDVNTDVFLIESFTADDFYAKEQ